MSPKSILITGAYGLIGNLIYDRLAEKPDVYDVYGLSRRRHPSERILEGQAREIPDEKFYLADLSDFESIRRAMENMEVVVHMAADPSGRSGWGSILANNVIGTYHVFEACRLARVKRIIFASTLQVNSGYRTEEPYGAILEGRYRDIPDEIPIMTHERPTRPLNLYASSKVWGEALAHFYANRYGISCICLRIGWVVAEDLPPLPMSRSAWCSKRDMAQLVERCINAPENVQFDVFFGVSDNRYRWVDIDHAREVLGYVPQDRAEDSA